MRYLLFLLLVLLSACASMPLPDSARDRNGNRYPDICYQWTYWGQTHAIMCPTYEKEKEDRAKQAEQPK